MGTMAVMKSKMNAHPFSNLDTEHLLHQPFRGMDPSQYFRTCTDNAIQDDESCNCDMVRIETT